MPLITPTGIPTEVDPAITQQYAELFRAEPLDRPTQKKFDRIMDETAEESLRYYSDHLAVSRMQFARSTCGLFTDATHPETAQLMFEQGVKAYNADLMGVMVFAGGFATQRVADIEAVPSGEAVKRATASVVGTETLERLRSFNDAFVDTFHLMNKKNPPIERVKRYARFVTQYSDRPTHILLKDFPGALDIPAAEVLYADSSAAYYSEAFDKVVAEAQATHQTPNTSVFALRALHQTVTNDLSAEIAATQQALSRVL